MILSGQVKSCIRYVCPFSINPDVVVSFDVLLKRFGQVYPASGSQHSAITLFLKKIAEHSDDAGWVNV